MRHTVAFARVLDLLAVVSQEVDHCPLLATILSAAMMLRYSFDMTEDADRIEAAVQKVLSDGVRTGDIMSEGCKRVSCSEMGDAVVAALA